MENFIHLAKLFVNPGEAISEIMDSTNWMFAAVLVILISIGLNLFVNYNLVDNYATNSVEQSFSNVGSSFEPTVEESDTGFMYVAGKRSVPLVGYFAFTFSTTNSFFLAPLVVLSLFYFPFLIIVASIAGRLGNPGVILQRDLATFSTCGLMAWSAAHLPALLIGFLLNSVGTPASVFWIPWIVGALFFGFLMLHVLRTVFGMEYVAAVTSIVIGVIGYALGSMVFQFIGPWLLSPFLLIFAIIFFFGFLRGQVTGMGNSMRQRRDFKRHLQNATVNPNDADAHVQLGLIYAQRRQTEKAREHFEKAFEIDNEEIDANFELGKLARESGDLQKAIEHFSVVVEQNDRYSLSEIWREIGITYLNAEQLDVAEDALEKFVTRREYDSEGQYYFGLLWKKRGDVEKARHHFEKAIEAVETAPYYRKRELSVWARKASKEM